MRIQQRAEVPDSFSERSVEAWLPTPEAPDEDAFGGGELPPIEDDDRYVTVDEHVEATIGVVVSDWPMRDEFGLSFPGHIDLAWFDAGELQDTVDQLRRRAGQIERPLRIGDTFWVRGFSPTSLDVWEDLRDITQQARAMTKAAVAVAVLGAVQPPEQDRALTAEPEPEPASVADAVPPPGGSATARPTI